MPDTRVRATRLRTNRRNNPKADYPSPLSVAVKGALAGLAGTAAITVAMQNGPQVLEERLNISLSPEPPRDPDVPEDPTAEPAGRVSAGVFDHPLEAEEKQTAGQAIHWGYGTLWGVLFGILQGSLRWPVVPGGTLFGALVGGVASTVVPAMGLAPSPTEQPKRFSAMQLGYHLIFGWVTALTFWLLTLRD